ncbi:TPA: transposase [Salmonella enterica subsp. enterica serovar Blitta]|nr:transposase [Salmonella enterica subsp. enterica serovar Blitta]
MRRLPDIRKVIYTTNAIESLNSVIRHAIKKRKVFPTDDAVKKVVWLAIRAGKSLKGEDVVSIMETLRGLDKRLQVRIQTYNSSEFISKSRDKWAYEHCVTMDFSRPGKPTDNPFIESFNSSLRDECLNLHWFLSVEDTQEKLDNWCREYNHERMHSSLNGMTPAEFIRSLRKDEDL